MQIVLNKEDTLEVKILTLYDAYVSQVESQPFQVMRDQPLVGDKLRSRLLFLLILAGFYLFLPIRELGNLVFAIFTGNSYSFNLLWHFVPDVEVHLSASTPKLEILSILSGPIATLSVGYLLLLAKIGRRLPLPITLFAAIVSYLCLILDPAYFGFAGLFSHGGEPDDLEINGLSRSVTIPIAIIIFVLNLYLVKKLLIPHLRNMLSEKVGE